MLTGSTFALLCALTFAFAAVSTRRAVIKGPALMHGVFISILISLPFLLGILIASGQTGRIFSFSLSGYIWLSSAGILHFVIGRWMFFKSVQFSGANITSILRRTDSLVALLLGVALLGEPLSFPLVFGILLTVFGVIITSLNPNMVRDKQAPFLNLSSKALFFGLGTGVLWGITPVLMKVGLQGSNAPVAGAFISFFAATVALSFSLLNRDRRNSFSQLPCKVIGLYCMVGLLAGIANMFRFLALNLSPASVVTPLLSTTPVFLVAFSFLFNRKLEVFNLPVIVGTIAVVIGAILLV
ncbi:MAG: EamA family transporter [Desulfobacterales bacterium]|nr:EamA family transporter [Desulfobacterales bacterium]